MSNIIHINGRNSSGIEPNKEDIKTFMHVVFGNCSGLIPLRSFAEKGNESSRPISNSWIRADDEIVNEALNFANLANRRQGAFYVIPGTVPKRGQAGSADIIQMQTLLIDIDDGDTESKLAILEDALGQATMIVESGGITAEGHAKLHIYWQLSKTVNSDGDLQNLLQLRHQIALAVGGDTHFKSAHQPIRVAGSIYHKNDKCKLVKIRSYNLVEYELEELIKTVNHLSTLDNSISASGTTTALNSNCLSINQLLISKVYEGGSGEQTRFNHIRRVIGYWLQRYHTGLISQEEAIEEIHGYNLANMVPPWSTDKVNQAIDSIWKLHVEKYGQSLREKKENDKSNELISIDPAKWQGSPPEREWILEDWLPRGYVTALYGDGGVGKSLFAQQLMTCLATGNSFLGLNTKISKVYALMCEDDKNELWRRQTGINERYGLKMEDLVNIRLVSRVGENNLLMIFNNSDVGQLTEFFNSLRQDILEYKPDLIILDTAADLFGGNENNRPQVRQFIQVACGALARETGGAVLLCAHPSEGGIQKGTGSGGSTAWNNTVRSRWYLKRPNEGELTTDHRILSKVKSNYAKLGQDEYLKWENGAFDRVIPNTVSLPIAGKTQNARNSAERDRKTQLMLRLIDIEAANGRVYTMNQFAEKFEDNVCNNYGFGSRRSINDRLSTAATQGWIKFFNDPERYNLNISKSRYGYLCGDQTMIKTEEIIDLETGEIAENLIQIVPTHYKCPLNGSLLPLQNYQNEDNENE